MPIPNILDFGANGGNWESYEANLYAIFERDIVRHDLRFRGIRVGARRMPAHERRWACYWHLISEGRVEDERLPDLRHCERLPWVRWIIENGNPSPEIDVWENTRQRETNMWLWYREEYLVILGQRRGHYLPRSAHCTDRSQTVAKLQKERDVSGQN